MLQGDAPVCRPAPCAPALLQQRPGLLLVSPEVPRAKQDCGQTRWKEELERSERGRGLVGGASSIVGGLGSSRPGKVLFHWPHCVICKTETLLPTAPLPAPKDRAGNGRGRAGAGVEGACAGVSGTPLLVLTDRCGRAERVCTKIARRHPRRRGPPLLSGDTHRVGRKTMNKYTQRRCGQRGHVSADHICWSDTSTHSAPVHTQAPSGLGAKVYPPFLLEEHE